MQKLYSISLLPGDGIGNEISLEAKKILNWVDTNTDLNLECVEGLVGGISIDTHGTPLCDKTLERIKKSDAIILGAVGGLKWEKLPFESRPERGLLKIRKELDLFANFRPAIVFDSLISSSSLKPEIIKDLDILIIRELTGGIYFGEPRGVEKINKNLSKGYNTLVYTTPEIKRIARVAFEASQQRSKKLCSVDKANVLESTELWREVVTSVAKDFPDVELSHMYVDNASMQLVRNPKQFDVIVTDNLFGDILSDEAAMLTGSLGLLPSASLGAKDKDGNMRSMYEPVHGSAPDIAGKGLANPIATILSFAMALKYSLNLDKEAKELENAVQKVLNDGLRTKDILSKGNKEVSTKVMGDAVIAYLQK